MAIQSTGRLLLSFVANVLSRYLGIPSQLNTITGLWPAPNHSTSSQRLVCKQLPYSHCIKLEWPGIESVTH